ncbi:MAG: ABC transporter substrate-binding protein [Candidatus Aenigmarchaeota archaeon]|nr:ABC transporter substrate-binding protein [Candidatus Aenigmarchaeota archaeon]
MVWSKYTVLAVFVAAVVIALLVALNTAQRAETIKIGTDYALTGNLARYGDWATRGINLAAEEINSQGEINGEHVEIIFEDSKGQPSDAVTAYNKLKNVDGVKYVITFQSSVALAVAKLANEDKIVQMDVSATTPSYSTPDDYTFRSGIVATQLAKESADVLFNKLNATKAGILYINNDFGRGMLNVFKNSYKGEIAAEESFDQDTSDFRTQLLKLKEANVSTIFLVSHIKEGGILVRQAREMGLNAKFFSDVYSVEGPEFINTAKDAAEGIIYVSPKFDVNGTDPAVSSFVTRYREKYGEEPVVFAAQAYDGLIALAKALKNCKYEDTDCVRQELMKLDMEGASGHIKFDINGDVQKPVELKIISNGTYMTYGG